MLSRQSVILFNKNFKCNLVPLLLEKKILNNNIEETMTRPKNSSNNAKPELPVKFNVELEKAAKQMRTNKKQDLKDRYYLLVCTDFESRNTTVCGLDTDYDEAVLNMYRAYQNYMNDEEKYIVRCISQTDVLIYKRSHGYLWSNKSEFLVFKLISYQM